MENNNKKLDGVTQNLCKALKRLLAKTKFDHNDAELFLEKIGFDDIARRFWIYDETVCGIFADIRKTIDELKESATVLQRIEGDIFFANYRNQLCFDDDPVDYTAMIQFLTEEQLAGVPGCLFNSAVDVNYLPATQMTTHNLDSLAEELDKIFPEVTTDYLQSFMKNILGADYHFAEDQWEMIFAAAANHPLKVGFHGANRPGITFSEEELGKIFTGLHKRLQMFVDTHQIVKQIIQKEIPLLYSWHLMSEVEGLKASHLLSQKMFQCRLTLLHSEVKLQAFLHNLISDFSVVILSNDILMACDYTLHSKDMRYLELEMSQYTGHRK